MKLHLPVCLLKAVLTGLLSVACFTVNSGTVWAEESSVSILSEGKTPSVSISSPGAAALTSTPDGTLIIMNLDGGHLYGASYSTFDVVADMQIDSMRISDGYTRAVYNFNGDISGSGVFERTSAAKSDYQTYVFSGDMSAYSGTMCLSKANDNSTLKFVNNTSGTGAIAIAAGNTLVVSGATMNNSSIISSGVLEVWDTATFTHDISVNGTLSLGRGSALVNNGTFTFADTALINLQHATYTTDTAGNRTYQLFSASGSGSSNLSSLTAANITGISTGGWEWTLNDDGSITAIDVGRTLTYAGGTMTWNTSYGNAVFSSAGSAVAFASGDKVKFSGNSTVSLGEDITTREMTVGAGATVVLTTTEHTLNAESVVVDGTLQLKNGGQNGALTGDITVRGQLDFAAGDVTGWSSSLGIKSINILKDGNLHISVGGNQNQTAAGLVIGLHGGTITGVSNANLDLAYGGSQYGYSSISAHAAEGATSETPTVSSISGTSLSLRQKATTISVAENARLDISSIIKEKSSTDVLNGEGALAAGKIAGLTKTGAGELRLTGANTYTQNTTVAEGTLTLADGGSLASSSITVNDGAVFRLDAAEELAVSASGSLGGSGTLIKTGLGSASLGSLADSFAGRIELQQGSLSLNSPLVISSGRELALGMNGAVLNSDLYLGDGLLSTSLSDAGVSTSLNDHSLILSGGTVLMLQGAFHKVTDLFTGVGSLLGADGNELVLDSSNNAAALYFDLSRPGMGFWTNSTLVLSSSGTLQLVKPSNISIPAGYTEVLVDDASDIKPYSSSATDVAFRLTADVTVDGRTSELMTSSADSWCFTSNSVDNLQFLTFSNATKRLFYVSSNEKLEFHGLKSVTFSGNTASSSSSAYGGAIDGNDGSTITLNDNGSVTFSGNTATADSSYSAGAYGGAIYGDTITLSGNGSVTFSGNTADSFYSSAYGGAIYGYGTITLSGNGSVTFSGNTTDSSHSYACGGAIYGDTITLSENGSVEFSGNTSDSFHSSARGGAIYGDIYDTIMLSGNGSVTFSGNTADSYANYAYGGAIYGSSDSTIMLSGNVSVEFSGNTASSYGGYAYGGAIYGYSNSTIELSGNGSVEFSGNRTDDGGGAIYGDTITLSGNDSVTFSGNTAHSGGAIYGGYNSTIELSGNGSVEFSGNTASSGGAIDGGTIRLSGNGSVTFSGNTASSGGAIYGDGNLSIRNNDSVLFEKNAEKSGSSYCLRSIYAGGSGDVISLSAAEGKSIEFRDSVYIDSGSTVNLNADYTDADGLVHKQTGDIIFTGAYTEQHLNELLAADGLIRTATAEEILNSRTTEVRAMTNLYGGRLCVEEGSVYKGYGITAHEGSAATVLVKDATLNHAGYDLVFHAGTSLELVGDNAASANRLQMHTGSSLIFRESAGLVLDGTLNVEGTGTLQLENGSLSAQKIDGTGGISITGGRLELQDDTDALAVDGAVSISNTTLSGNWCAEGLTVDGVSVTAGSEISLNNLTLKSVLSNEGTLVLGGEVSIAREDVDCVGGGEQYTAGVSGYRYIGHSFTLVEGSGQSTAAADVIWKITENGAEQDYRAYSLSYTNGVLTAYIERDITTYWVNSEVTYDGRSEFDTANTLVLNGGELTLAAALGDNLTKGIRAEADSSLNMGAGLAESDDSVSVNVSVGVTVTVDEPVIGHGTLLKSGDGILSVKELADSFAGSLVLQQGTLHMAESLVISKGRELHVGKTDAVLDTTLQLSDGMLCMDFSGTGETVSLNNTNLHLQGETGLQFRDAGKEDSRVYDLFTDIYGLKDANGNALVLSADNNAAALYFDAERPGTGFWKNATLQLTDDGTLQLVRYTDITIPTGYARTVVMDEPSDFTRYAGLTQDVAFRLAADVTFDASAAVMTNLAASRYFTSASADAPAAIAFRNSENRMFYVKENETLIMKALRAVTFEDLVVSADEAISGGAIYVSDNSGITLEDNGAVIFSGTTLTDNGAEAQGGALYAGAASPVVLNGNGSVEFLKNSVVGSSSHGGAMYSASPVLITNNNGVIFRDNSSVSRGGAIDAGAELTLLDNGSVDFNGNTSGQGGAINAAANVVLEANGVISFSGNEATSGSGAAIYATGAVSLIDNGSVEFSGNTAVTGGGAIYGSQVTVSDNIGVVSFIGNASERSGSSSSHGGAIYGGSQVTLSGNNSVVFKENSAYNRGGAIYTPGTVRLSGNGSVEFRDNVASVYEGGAIYAKTVELCDNAGGVVFTGNKAARGNGGAIYASSSIILTGNGSVEFSENTAKYGGGGAIWSSATVTINNHADAVLFRGNTASSSSYGGGAVYASSGVTLSHNGSVEFAENSTAYRGGAIFGNSVLRNNGSVEFCANSSVGYGGAIYTSGSVTIAGNDEVAFARNVEKSDSNYRLRSLYLAGDSSADKLTLSAGKGQSISFYDSVYMGATGSVALNADYTDAEGVTQKASGTILFSGATTEDDLKTAKNGVAGTEEEILNSRTSEINSAATLYGGTLQVQDKAVLKLNGGLTVAAGSTATMQVQEGATLNLSSMTIAKDTQTSIEVSGGSAMTASGQVSVAEGGLSALKVQDSRVDWAKSSLALSSGNHIELQDNAEFNLSDMTITENAQASIELSGGSAMTASGQVSVAAGGLSTLKVQDSRVDWGQSSLALSSGNRIELQDNAEFNLSSMTIAKDAQASIELSGGSVMTSSGQVSVAAGGSASLQVQKSELNLNGGLTVAEGSTATMQVQDGATLNLSSMTIAKDAQASIELSGGSVMTASGQVSVLAGGLASLKVQNSEVNLGSNALELTSGSLVELQNGASLSLSELTVAAGAELKAGGYIAPVAEVAKPVAFSLAQLEADSPIVNTGSVNHIQGDLRLSGGSTLNLQDSYLTVSGDLVLDVTAESEKVVVDLMPGIAKDEFSQVVLFEVAGTVTFGENGTASDSEVVYYQFAEDYFTGDWISQDTWLVYDRSTNLVYLEGVNIIAAVPEPTTSMLGLMGLVAFTLRRRRK